MPEPATADLIAELLLRHYRDPMRFRALAAREAHALGSLDAVLRLALGRPVEFSDPALRAPTLADELQRAAAFYIQQCFFREGATHYEVLGLAPDAPADAVRENFRLLMQLVHPDRHGEDSVWPEGYAARANRAHAVLKSPASRADYDRQQAAAYAQEAAARARGASGRGEEGGGRAGAVQRQAAARPARGPSRRQPAAPSVWPEWLTAGVGGFVRRHPAFTVFAGLIGISALMIGAAMRPEPEHMLSAEAGYVAPPPQPAKQGRLERERERARMAEVAPAERATVVDQMLEPRAAVVETPVAAAPRIEPTQANPAPAAPPVTAMARAPSTLPQAVAVPVPAAQPAAPVSRPDTPVSRAISAPPVAAPVRIAEARPVVPAVAPTVSVPVAAPAVSPPPRGTAPVPVAVPPATVAAAPLPSERSVAVLPPPPERAPVAVSPPPERTAIAVAPPMDRIPAAASPPPASAEVETLIATFVSSYESGRLSVFGGLFHDDAQANQQRGRAAIVGEYDQLFRMTTSRRMSISQMRWQSVGDRTEAKGELTLKTAWRDGREAEQRVVVDMELVRQGGRTVISRLGFQPR